MNDEIIAAIESEEAKLVQRLEAVRQMLAVYRGEGASTDRKAEKSPGTQKSGRTIADRMDKFGPYGQRIVDAVADLLPGNGGNPVPTRTLVEQLEALGVEINGENKVNSLSALLARSSKMKGYGRAGWTLQADSAGKMYGSVRGDTQEPDYEPAAKALGSNPFLQPPNNPFAKSDDTEAPF